MAAPKKVDYERIEPGWRAGIKSPAQLAAEYTEATGISVSHTAINKHFKKLGIPRDLADKVKSKAESMVLQAMVTGKVSTETTKPDAEIINGAAIHVATIHFEHRRDIKRSRSLVVALLEELEHQTVNVEVFEQLGELMRRENDAGVDKLNDLYHKVIGLSGRVANIKSLSEALKNLIGLERQAFNMDLPEKPADDPKDLTDAELESRIRDLESRARPATAG
jgi:predicted GNAT family acetyltransferase